MEALLLGSVTADIILQMTSTLTHLSNLYNKSSPRLTDLDGVGVFDRLEVAGVEISLPCAELEAASSLEWRCRGCFSISETRETVVATLAGAKLQTLVYPERMRIQRGTAGYSLDIKPSSNQDSGTYFCIVNNEAKPRIVYNLAIQDVPSTPGKPLIMSFSSSSVNLSWAPPLHHHFAPLKFYKLEVLEGETSTWTNYVTINTGSPESLYTVTNLKPFTVYSFRVIGVNHIGLSPPSLPSYHMMTLREPPRGKPTIINTQNISWNGIQVSWRPPEPDTIHGEFIGYRISLRLQHSEENIQNISIKDPEIQEYRFPNLVPFTQYVISIQVMNPEGVGPPATVLVITEEGVPSSPLNLTVVAVTNNGFVLQWSRPVVPNGRISGYRLFYSAQQFTNVKTINSTEATVSTEVADLDPYRKYNVFVKAFNSKNEGNSSASIQVMTDVSGPSAPLLTNLTCPDDRSVFMEWSKPDNFYHSVDRYRVLYKKKDTDRWMETDIFIPPIVTHPVERVFIKDLAEGAEYSLYIQAFTQSLYMETLQYPGNKSELFYIVAGKDCNRVQVSPMREGMLPDRTRLSLAILFGSLVVFLLLLVAVVLLAFWRRTLMSKRFYIPTGLGKDEEPMWDIQVDREDCSKTSVLSSVYIQHINLLHAEGDGQLYNEFNSIKTRVQGKTDGQPKKPQERHLSMKIDNVDTFQARNWYFYSPEGWSVESTEFWAFIIKSRIRLIISVDSDLDPLLPREPESINSLEIHPGREQTHPAFSVRRFEYRSRRGLRTEATPLVVLQFKSTVKGPRTKLDFLRFTRVCSHWRKSFGKPWVIGVRGLVYMTVDSMCLQLQASNEINIPAYIRYLGECTGIDDLTVGEYIFVHDVMHLAVQSKGSNVPTSLIPETLNPQYMENQFSACTEVYTNLLQYTAALSPHNQGRNNTLDYVAVDWSRVVLCPPVEGTDYINGTWVPGYSGEEEFILCQHPGLGALSQFWWMVWQTGSKLIVCLSVIPQQFWPVLHSPLVIPELDLQVWLESEGSTGGYRSAVLQLDQAGSSALVQLILCPNWPHQSVPVSNCVHLVDCVNKQMSSGPVVVVDSYGATEAGILCVLSSLVRQMDLEANVDVFYWFKSVHLSRPGVWVSPDNLGFVYRVLAELSSINSTRK